MLFQKFNNTVILGNTNSEMDLDINESFGEKSIETCL
jgi:hypothetical protein